MRRFYFIVASGFGSGYAPLAPGTAGSVFASVFSYFFIRDHWYVLIGMIVFFFFLGVYASTMVEEELQIHDPPLIVIDEMVGMWISVLFVPPTVGGYVFAFLAFRLFDIWKPFPINKFQGMPAGWGVMLDDVIAGCYALLAVQVVLGLL